MTGGDSPAGAGNSMPGRVTVLVEDAADSGELAARLREAGMQVDQVLGAIGVITGSILPEHRARLLELPGVAGVEDETTFRALSPEDDR